MKVYILEDDKSIRELVTYTLEHFGYDARGFAAPGKFWDQMEVEVPELVLLDLMLPEEDGLTVLRKIRQNINYNKIPVIILSAKETEYDRVLGLDSGADDYVAKPFGMMELVARIRAVSRRVDIGNNDQVLKYDNIQLFTQENKLIVNGEVVPLRFKEYQILKLLMSNKGKILRRRQILDEVWGANYNGTERVVDVHVRNLREKLGLKASGYLQTVRGFGYKFDDNYE